MCPWARQRSPTRFKAAAHGLLLQILEDAAPSSHIVQMIILKNFNDNVCEYACKRLWVFKVFVRKKNSMFNLCIYNHLVHYPSTQAIIQIFNICYLVVESTHMQGGVSRCILGAHVSSIEQQVFQVLHMAIAACLKEQIQSFTLFRKLTLICTQNQKGTIRVSLRKKKLAAPHILPSYYICCTEEEQEKRCIKVWQRSPAGF